ncbi:MAG: tetratricopeptide repeat protein [Chloroherpetonaceae bacterium]|nr:tetratricopeptide repeat protein [Chloroherpetonaceae bacterium]
MRWWCGLALFVSGLCAMPVLVQAQLRHSGAPISPMFDTAAVQRLLEQARFAFEQRNFYRADSLALLAFHIAERLPHLRLQAHALRQIGIVKRNLDEYDTAITIQKRVLAIADTLGDAHLQAMTQGSLALLYHSKGFYGKSFAHYFDALRGYEQFNDKAGIAITLNNLATLYADRSAYHDALRCYQRAHLLFEAIGDTMKAISTMISIGDMLQQVGYTKLALDSLKRSLEKANEFGNVLLIADAMTALGDLYMQESRLALALEHKRRALAIYQEMQERYAQANILREIADILLAQRQLSEALACAVESREIAKSIGNRTLLKNALFTLSDIYESAGYPTQALLSYKHAQQIKDSLLTLEEQRRTAELREQYETDKKEQEIALLEKERALERLNRERQRDIFLAITGLLALTAGVVSIALYIKQKNQKLLEEKNCLIAAQKALVETQRDELAAANQLKNDLLAIASHDLKNPLQTIIGFASLLKEKIATEHEVLMIERIESASKRMLHLIKELLDTAAIESGKLELHKERLNLNDLVQVIAEHNQPNATRKRITLHLHLAGEALVLGDRSRLQEVMDNLVSNAIKYSPEGKSVFISTVNLGQSIRYVVKDEGQGLSEEDMTKLFGRFQKLSSRPTGGESSTGLGLSIVKQLVELHGGRVWAESEGKGKGATFFVELPKLLPEETSNPLS